MSTERADIVSTLGKHRALFLDTVRDITDEQGLTTSTVSALTLTSLVKHVSDTEKGWAEFITKGPDALGGDVDWSAFEGGGDGSGEGGDWGGDGGEFVDPRFVVEPGETLEVLKARYAEVARTTDELVATVDLDAAQPLPKAPWFEAGATWSARRVFLHIIAETAQHAGHADIIREAIDGAKTMG